MSGLQTLFISFLLINILSFSLAHDNQDEDFFRRCPPSPCGSITVRFPLRLESSPTSCGAAGLILTCSNNNTLLLPLPSLPINLTVTEISYYHSQLTVHIGSGLSSPYCPVQNLISLGGLRTPPYQPHTADISLLNCSQNFTPGPGLGLAGPVSCLSGPGYFVYVVSTDAPIFMIPNVCVVSRVGGAIPIDPYIADDSFIYQLSQASYFSGTATDTSNHPYENIGNLVESFQNRNEVNLTWMTPAINNHCRRCEKQRKYCGLNWKSKHTFCSGHKGSNAALISGTSCGGVGIVSVLICFYIYRKFQKKKEAYMRIERFLATYRATKPMRYSFPQIKKISKRFKHKLGQGGFGSVYKGELSSGIPVAIKMLEKSKDDGKEFINEVATIGRIHHVNVVRLLGFCSEGTNHALVYEFMANGSLEKFIFLNEGKSSRRPFSMEKLLEIAIGVAQGIKYLHQGCDQRILHFDIKPHNILLDHNFNSKISDFGLAKLCSRGQSIITMTAARGTMGYIAPEMYSRNFGSVSYKSDVYSFGMLLLEMVSGKRIADPNINENDNEVYFPEWIYGQLIAGENVALAIDKEGVEDIVKRIVIVALWCIQWNPVHRPSMSRVVQLLAGNVESLQIPPKPFIPYNSN